MVRARLAALVLAAVAVCLLAPAAMAAPGGDQPVEEFHGTLIGPDGQPVADAQIVVEQDGKQVAEATTGNDGAWQVEVPEPGDYDVVLQTDSLPDGVVPRAPGDERRADVSLTPGQSQTLLFPLTTPGEQEEAAGDDGSGSTSDGGGDGGSALSPVVSELLQLTVEGLKYGLIIAITAIGLSLVFGTTQLINFAHGELVTIGAVVAWFFNVSLGMPLALAALVAVACGVLLGVANERGVWRPLRRRGTARIQLFIISIGLSLLLRHVVLWLYGSRPQPYGQYSLQQPWDLGPISVTPRDLAIMGASLAVLLGVGLMLQKTRIGKAMRAVSDNRDLAAASGINVDRVILVVWMVGGGLAALGGVFFGLAQIVSWDMGFRLLLLMFAGVILGGLGTAYGAVAGSLVVGLVAQLSTFWFQSELQNAWAMLVLIVTLMIRPQGIFGRKERIG